MGSIAGSVLSEVERFLEEFHRRHPSATSSLLGGARAGRWRTSYDALLEVVPGGPSPLAVLDLACGDGFLLERLAARRQPGLALLGVDLSAEDLRIAEARLGPAAALRRERAQAMSLPDASVDVVLCHMALMLMDDVEAVVASIRRVLRPGGTFSAVVGGDLRRGDAFEVFVELVRAAYERDGAPRMQIGDPRTRTRKGLAELLCERAGFAQPIAMHDVLVRLDAPPAALWGAMSLTYDAEMLSKEAWARIEEEFLAEVAPRVMGDGAAPCSLGLLQVTCARR
jgi:SAM-dependent methyltransferase